MLLIPENFLRDIISHARDEFPNEACGILAGKGAAVQKLYRMTNVERSPERFFMDGKEQLGVMKEMRQAGLDMAAIYHSHPHSHAYPSAHDVELAFYPEVSYVIVSLEKEGAPYARSFRIVNGKIEEEDIEIR